MWILVYKNLSGKRTHKTLGNALAMTEFEACVQAREYLEALREGRNPFAGDMLFEAYFDQVRMPWVRANKRSWADDQGVFNRYIRQPLGGVQLRKIRSHHIQALIDALRTGAGTTEGRGKLADGTVYQVIALIKAMMKWGCKRGDINIDPTVGIRQIKLNNQRHVRYSESELAAIGVALQSAPDLLRLLFVMLLPDFDTSK